jgi:hypothetical protein
MRYNAYALRYALAQRAREERTGNARPYILNSAIAVIKKEPFDDPAVRRGYQTVFYVLKIN